MATENDSKTTPADQEKANEEAVKKEIERISKLEQAYRELLKNKEEAHLSYVRALKLQSKAVERLAKKDSKQRTSGEIDEVEKLVSDTDEKFVKHNDLLEDCFRSLGDLFGAKVGFYEQVINSQNNKLKELDTKPDQKKA